MKAPFYTTTVTAYIDDVVDNLSVLVSSIQYKVQESLNLEVTAKILMRNEACDITERIGDGM